MSEVVSEPVSAKEPSAAEERPEALSARPDKIWERAIYRWTAISAVMLVLLIVYTQHPYYRGSQFAPFRPFYVTAFVAWLTFGVFYVKATLQRFSARRFVMRDGGLHLILLARAWTQGKLLRKLKNRRLKTTVLGIAVKSFFTPLMTGFFSHHVTVVADAWLRHKHLAPLRFTVPDGNALRQITAWVSQVAARVPDFLPNGGDFSSLFAPSTWTNADVSWMLDVLYNIVFMIDCGWALVGYSLESRWLDNKTRSVEPTAFGWAVCLACYPPYNNVLGTYLPLETGPTHAFGQTTFLVMRGVSVLLFAIYASATVSFGFKFSNLTNRGIVSRGPYRFVRHPAYLCKCLAWWLEHIPTMTVYKGVFLTLLCGVYATRAWTEERHLGKDPAYREYKKKVPWILVPRVF